jgi:YD repeat-containing protein
MTTISYAYDDAGRMTTATLPSGTGIVSTYSYDNADRLTGISHVKGGSTTIASVAYTLDDVGNRTQRVDQQGTHSYAYDDLNRLTSVTYPGPTTSYAFDALGNRTSMTVAGNTTTYAYDDDDRITSVTPPSPASVINYTWDDNGDLTARGSDSFSWDYEDRMVSATVNSVTTTFAYRGDGAPQQPHRRRQHDDVHLGHRRRATGGTRRREPVRLWRWAGLAEAVWFVLLLPGRRLGLDDGGGQRLRLRPEQLHVRRLRDADQDRIVGERV